MKALLLSIFFKIFSSLSLRANRKVGAALGTIIYFLNNRLKKTTEKNINFCFPELSQKIKQNLIKQSLKQTGMVATESFWIWGNPPDKINRHIESVAGIKDLTKALKESGVLLLGPHLGSWELITFYCGQLAPCSAFYKSPNVPELDKIIRQGRSQTGARHYSGDLAAVKQALSCLKNSEIFIFLSDQEPAKGQGLFSPFFQLPALTPTLPYRLVQKTQCKVFQFAIERTTKGFKISFIPLDYLNSKASTQQFLDDMNASFEKLIKANPEQYEWSYKRFKTPSDGDYDVYPF